MTIHDPWSENELSRVLRAARAGTLDPDEVGGLVEEVRRLRKEAETLSRQLQIESEDRQAKTWERDYWEDLCRHRGVRG